ncbi:MFS transporter [Streptomyces hydrogenans]|uniref:MFS transporter n=1 Tax=Streptomyces hydrogenans TaxID=1873719 RepID=UPI00345D0FBF
MCGCRSRRLPAPGGHRSGRALCAANSLSRPPVSLGQHTLPPRTNHYIQEPASAIRNARYPQRVPVDSEWAGRERQRAGRDGTQQPTSDAVTPIRHDRPSEAAADHGERHIEGLDVTLGQFAEWPVDEQVAQPVDRGPGRVSAPCRRPAQRPRPSGRLHDRTSFSGGSVRPPWRSPSTRRSSTSHFPSPAGNSTRDLQWTVNAQNLAFASLALTTGAVGDRFGRRPTLLACLTGFALTGLAGGLADSASALVLIRFLMGTSAAVMFLKPLSIITNVSSDRGQ